MVMDRFCPNAIIVNNLARVNVSKIFLLYCKMSAVIHIQAE